MSERVEEARAQQEGEIRQRHLRIGLMGPIGAGKTALSQVLGESWGVTPIGEQFTENPYLEKEAVSLNCGCLIKNLNI